MASEPDPSEAVPGKRKMHPNSLANLAPRFPPGVSGNPSGLTSDGRSPKGARLAASLESHLAKPGAMDRLAKRWIMFAEKGSAAHLAMIADRLYPVEKESGEGRQILTGIKLELSEGKTTATIISALDAANGVSLLGSTSNQGIMGSLCPAGGELTIPSASAPPATAPAEDQASAPAQPVMPPTTGATEPGATTS